MEKSQGRKQTIKSLFLVAVVAVLTAILITVIQVWLFETVRPAITGGVVGAITAALAFNIIKNQKAAGQSTPEK